MSDQNGLVTFRFSSKVHTNMNIIDSLLYTTKFISSWPKTQPNGYLWRVAVNVLRPRLCPMFGPSSTQ